MWLMASNNLKIAGISCLLFFTVSLSNAQTYTRYWVRFKDKEGSLYSTSSPDAFLSTRAIQRRVKQSISVDVTDLPVNQAYVNQINATGAKVFQCSKWLNAAVVTISNPSQLQAINSLTCVLGTNPVGRYHSTLADELKPVTLSSFKTATHNTSTYSYGSSLTQVSQVGVDCMHEAGYRGQTMIIGVIDSGFDQVNVNPVFDSLRHEGRILGTRDIVAGNSSVYEDHNHGAMVLSCISGNSPNNLIGTAPKASVYLLRSEDISSEKLLEESNWVLAAEYADSVGVDIITTSLGYTTFDNAAENHTYASLDGKTSMASVAATMAARKGIFVLNSAGNEGNSSWRYLTVPADADSICTVGSVNGSGIHSSFSSVGPTADGRIKPDVSAMGEGTYVCGPGYNFFAGIGTSFACPIMAGAVACLWQANPTKNNMQLLKAIKSTASKSASPDNTYGWGIPNMCAAHNYLNGTTLNSKTINQHHGINVYPNPAHGQVYISTEFGIDEVILTDVVGHQIESIASLNTQNNYSLKYHSDINAGIYFISIKTKHGVFNTKLIHQ